MEDYICPPLTLLNKTWLHLPPPLPSISFHSEEWGYAAHAGRLPDVLFFSLPVCSEPSGNGEGVLFLQHTCSIIYVVYTCYGDDDHDDLD